MSSTGNGHHPPPAVNLEVTMTMESYHGRGDPNATRPDETGDGTTHDPLGRRALRTDQLRVDSGRYLPGCTRCVPHEDVGTLGRDIAGVVGGGGGGVVRLGVRAVDGEGRRVTGVGRPGGGWSREVVEVRSGARPTSPAGSGRPRGSRTRAAQSRVLDRHPIRRGRTARTPERAALG